MKFLKKHYKNILFASIILILFLTPAGFQLKVLLHKYINFSPSEIAIEEQVTLANYNWQLTDLNGAEINFNEFKNKVVIINFWATWCPPCVAEMESFQELYDSYKNEVVFLFVANDKEEKVNSFISSNNYSFPNYFEASSTPLELVSSSIPATYIINKNGKIVMEKKGSANWNSDSVRKVIDKLIKE